tara:strand:+ start:449 stop:649 length:201 start_codon:yes stop_codon:yes gene_type:complete
MKYEVLKDGMAKDGRSFSVGAIVELEKDYAEHLIGKCIVRPVNFEKQRPKKNRAVVKPEDLEQATE